MLAFFTPLLFAGLTIIPALAQDFPVSASPGFASGRACPAPLGNQGSAGPNDPFWLEAIKHQGRAPFNAAPNDYKVFRNVKVRLQTIFRIIQALYISSGLWCIR